MLGLVGWRWEMGDGGGAYENGVRCREGAEGAEGEGGEWEVHSGYAGSK